MKIIPAIASLVVAAALLVPTVGKAAESRSVRVSYADLNLASAAGQRMLQGRISSAARTVCDVEDSRELALASATNLCRVDAIAGAQPAYHAAVAAALHPSVTVLDGAALIVTAR